ncbi:GNAT family N-acetyltransferase [Aurantibacillus circumpalustris]|uniref:GNAT family N-acetyltransferase n=1 Tax=Aurantibacillus circumpalustris TaxID=3036359 RepID=UPI00295B8C51|nr:GNAT family N-acetyltransferase [Aurantibacillus circumpalustris]
MYSVKVGSSAKELEAILALRYKILRQPWNQPADTATDNLEGKSINAYIEDTNGNVIACARLQENENKVGQVRYMSVDNSYQGKGLGKLLLVFLERKAKDLNLSKIELQARENAVKFYEANNYVIKEKTFLLWGIIQHYLMEKSL